MATAIKSKKETGIGKTVAEEFKEQALKLKARGITFESSAYGIEVKMPGKDPYSNLGKVEIQHTGPMEIEIYGNISTIGKTKISDGRVEVTGYRVNKAEQELDQKRKDLVLVKDPELTLYTEHDKIPLNQAIGTIVLNIKDNTHYRIFK